MTGSERVRAAFGLVRLTQRLAEEGIKNQCSDLYPDEIKKEFARRAYLSIWKKKGFKYSRQELEFLNDFMPHTCLQANLPSFFGGPRATFDIDIVVEIKPEDVPKIVKEFSGDYYIAPHAIYEAISCNTSFNIIHQKTQIKTNFYLVKNDSYSKMRFGQRKGVRILGQKTSIITAKDLILIKLLWYKESESTRHLEDAQSIVAIQGNNLDKKYLRQWAKRQGTIDILTKFLKD
jgi:hypothetical protein